MSTHAPPHNPAHTHAHETAKEGPYEIPVELIDAEDDRQVSQDKIFALAESMRIAGQEREIEVTRKEGGRYQVNAGRNRRKAAILIGMKTLKCWVVSGSDTALFLSQVRENIRENYKPHELAEKLCDKRLAHMPVKEAADRIGISRTHAVNLRRLWNDPVLRPRFCAGESMTKLLQELAGKKSLNWRTAARRIRATLALLSPADQAKCLGMVTSQVKI